MFSGLLSNSGRRSALQHFDLLGQMRTNALQQISSSPLPSVREADVAFYPSCQPDISSICVSVYLLVPELERVEA